MEVLAVDFDNVEGILMLNASWCWKDQEQALLSLCLSLIMIVHAGDLWVVRFLHFLVKEYLTSPCLSASSRDISTYHISFKPVHMILGIGLLGHFTAVG